MTNTPPAPSRAPEPVDVEIVATVPLKPSPTVDFGPPRKWWQIWKRREKKPKRAMLLRLFGIGLWGTIKLALLCIIVGFLLLTIQFDPGAPDFDITDTLGLFLKNAFGAARWTLANFWKPALTGAGLVLPLWVLWRLISLPFRR